MRTISEIEMALLCFEEVTEEEKVAYRTETYIKTIKDEIAAIKKICEAYSALCHVAHFEKKSNNENLNYACHIVKKYIENQEKELFELDEKYKKSEYYKYVSMDGVAEAGKLLRDFKEFLYGSY